MSRLIAVYVSLNCCIYAPARLQVYLDRRDAAMYAKCKGHQDIQIIRAERAEIRRHEEDLRLGYGDTYVAECGDAFWM